MKNFDYFTDTSKVYSWGIDLSNVKVDYSKFEKNHKAVAKRYVCIYLEMTGFTSSQRALIPGAKGEIIQFGAVMLDENYNLLSKFSSFVKPACSSVTAAINQLTGITNENLENADDFLTVFDKFCFWRGEGDITTFCWSRTDFDQLWSELEAKGRHRYDLFAVLQNFVDLQKVFGKLVSSKTAVGLESAMKLLQRPVCYTKLVILAITVWSEYIGHCQIGFGYSHCHLRGIGCAVRIIDRTYDTI